MKNRTGFLAALAALTALAGNVNYDGGEGYRDTRPKPPPDEAARAKKREKFTARGMRRYERWLLSGGK